MNRVMNLHKEAKYYIEIKKLPGINGIQTTFPKKIIDSNDIKAECSKIYESEKHRLTIYKDKKVIRRVDIHEYFHRILILTDFYGMCHDYNINDNLYLVVDEDNNILDEKFDLYKILNIKKSKKETQFVKIFTYLHENKNAKSLIDEYNLEIETQILQDLLDKGGF